MFLRTAEPLPIGSLVQITVMLPNGRHAFVVAVRFDMSLAQRSEP